MSDPLVPSGVGTAFLYNTQTGGSFGYAQTLAAVPPNTNPPVIFEPYPSLSGGQLSVWIVATGPLPDWGGCQIWASADGGTSYGQLGVMMVGGVQGVLTSNFPSGLDPDTVNFLAVDVSESGSQVNSGTPGDADVGITLAYVDEELVGYSNVVLTAPNMYNLDTYLRRGMFDTSIGPHASGSNFALIAGHVFSHTYPSIMIGTTINFKFPSFNSVGGNLQDISTVAAYPYTLVGHGLARGIWATPLSVGGKFTNLTIDPWDNNYEIFDVQAPWDINFRTNFAGSPTPGCQIAPVATVTLTFQTIDTSGIATGIGTLTIPAGSTIGHFTTPAFELPTGYRLRMYAPLSVDATAAGLFGTIIGTRN